MNSFQEKSLKPHSVNVRDRSTVKHTATPLQWHSYHELLLITEGEQVKIHLPDQVLDLEIADFLLLPPGTLHELYCGPEGHARLFYVHLFASELPLERSSTSLSALRQLLFTNAWIHIHCSPDLVQELSKILQFCIREGEEKKPAHHMICQAMIMRALTLVVNYQQQDKQESHPGSQDLVLLDTTLNYVKNHPTQPLTLPEVAAAIGYSPSHLSKRFHALTGQTFKHYIDYLKMQQALEHLLQGKSISEISELLGYASSQSFSRAFRRIMKQSPARLLKKTEH